MNGLAVIEEHLAAAPGHLSEADRHLEKQRSIVAAFERDGRKASLAHELLATFETLRAAIRRIMTG
ncbi:hypothetical protein [Ensifer sp. LCM 4579]|uniref:hypothetical protein n=1 Tax=Ensifer sp. LCM 4579 TaxID=1848292 RepID=UPI0008DA182D|nr:hypothetical protein [Ensifer sp. LCM 4579]OHV72174.1 hypothetical protein LCM4579_12740 [Ensifer sp. LCM 4579]